MNPRAGANDWLTTSILASSHTIKSFFVNIFREAGGAQAFRNGRLDAQTHFYCAASFDDCLRSSSSLALNRRGHSSDNQRWLTVAPSSLPSP